MILDHTEQWTVLGTLGTLEYIAAQQAAAGLHRQAIHLELKTHLEATRLALQLTKKKKQKKKKRHFPIRSYLYQIYLCMSFLHILIATVKCVVVVFLNK